MHTAWDLLRICIPNAGDFSTLVRLSGCWKSCAQENVLAFCGERSRRSQPVPGLDKSLCLRHSNSSKHSAMTATQLAFLSMQRWSCPTPESQLGRSSRGQDAVHSPVQATQAYLNGANLIFTARGSLAVGLRFTSDNTPCTTRNLGLGGLAVNKATKYP